MELEIKQEIPTHKGFNCDVHICPNRAVWIIGVGQTKNPYQTDYYLCEEHKEDALDIYERSLEDGRYAYEEQKGIDRFKGYQ